MGDFFLAGRSAWPPVLAGLLVVQWRGVSYPRKGHAAPLLSGTGCSQVPICRLRRRGGVEDLLPGKPRLQGRDVAHLVDVDGMGVITEQNEIGRFAHT